MLDGVRRHLVNGMLEAHEADEVRRAKESFVSGRDFLSGVRPQIAASWSRCRDLFVVDPALSLAPRSDDSSVRCLDRDVLLTELGGLAAGIYTRLGEGVVTVVDGAGELVGAWGDGLPAASEAGLRPWYSWSESSSGTNGMGTALESHALVSVRGPEHWCEGFQDLACLGVPIVDPVTAAPMAAVNISTPFGAMPQRAPELLRALATQMQTKLKARARASGAELASAFEVFAGHLGAPAFAVDTGGRVVVANDAAGPLLGVASLEVRTDPECRSGLGDPQFTALLAEATAAAHSTAEWRGTARLALPGTGEWADVTLIAALTAGHPIGFFVSLGAADGVPLTRTPTQAATHPTTVVAHVHGRTLLLRPSEISLAQAEGNTVWLTTDRGRLRAADRGLTKLEQGLADRGFLRVHRRYLVNIARVREVGRGVNGELELYLDSTGGEAVPVARAQNRRVREQLGL